MDPLTGAIVAAVLWFFLRGIIGVAILFAFLAIGFAIEQLTGGDSPVVVGISVFVGWLAAIAWWIFAIIQTVLEVVRIVQLASGVPA